MRFFSKNSRFLKHISLVVICYGVSLVSLSAKDLAPTNQDSIIARITSALISKQHYRQHVLDDEISKNLFTEYFTALDPNKLYFRQSDIDHFQEYKTKLDDALLAGNINFAFMVYNLFVKRVKEFKEFADKTLDKGFDFTKKETFLFDRSKAPWPRDKQEQQELWRKKLKNDVLSLRLMERAMKEEKDKKKDNEASSWKPKSPKERIKKRIYLTVKRIEEAEDITVLQYYLNALTNIYGPHSNYFSPRTDEDFNITMRLSLVGIGAMLTIEDGYTKVIRLIPGGPAERGGQLKANDRIIAVAQGKDGQPVDIIDMPLDKVVNKIRGKKDTIVVLTVLKADKGPSSPPVNIAIKRDKVKLEEQAAHGEMRVIKDRSGKEKHILVITLSAFYRDFAAAARGDKDFRSSTRDVRNLIEKFEKKGPVDGLILDMRSNGGGSLTEAIDMTGLFIKQGPVVQVKNTKGQIAVQKDFSGEVVFDKPVIVMINSLSASATEILASALHDYKRAILVGDAQTHGKGTVQQIYDLKNFLAYMGQDFPAGAVKFTNGKFYRINGESTQLKGISPDIVFPSYMSVIKFGERILPHVLPWDTIKPVPHQIYQDNLDSVAKTLRKRAEKRMATNKKFKLLVSDIASYKKMYDKKEISLNEEERWNEYKKQEATRKKRLKLLHIDSDKKNKSEDLYLEETLNIMSDYLSLFKFKSSQ